MQISLYLASIADTTTVDAIDAGYPNYATPSSKPDGQTNANQTFSTIYRYKNLWIKHSITFTLNSSNIRKENSRIFV